MKRESKQVYKETTKIVRIDAGWHRILKIEAAKVQKSIKTLIEDSLSEWWSRYKIGKDYEE